jgi:hypothetical protein
MAHILNWNDVKFVDSEHGKRIDPKQLPMVKGAIQEYLTRPENLVKELGKIGYGPAKIQEYTVAGDFPASVLPIIEKYRNETAFDTGWQEIFKMLDFTNTKKNGFQITDVYNGLTFRLVLVGEKLKVYQAYGESHTLTFSRHGGAMGWDRGLIDDEEYWTIDDNMSAFRNTYYAYKAGLHYALIEAVAGTLAWQAHPDAVGAGVVGYTAGRDAATINAAVIQILTAVAGRGYSGVTPLNANFKILVPIQLYQRVREALALNLQGFAGSQNRLLPMGFQIVPTTMLATTNVFYVILPGNKLISAERQGMTLFYDFDSLSYTDTMSAWFRGGGTVADEDQIVRCATA